MKRHCSSPYFHYKSPKLPLMPKWCPCWCLQVDPPPSPPPLPSTHHGSTVPQCLTVFVPSAKEGPQSMQRHLTLFLLEFTKSSGETVACTALGQIYRYTNRHRHMLQRVNLPLWECFLFHSFSETKDKIKGVTIWLPNLEDNTHLSGLLYGSLDLPGHVGHSTSCT